MSGLEAAVAALFGVGLGDFVAERKRLSAELKAAGDKEGAALIAKLARPAVSVWVVNQLWRQERAAFDELVSAAARVKSGDRDASKLHREALARLKARAALLLEAAGNAASESTLRRVTTTLSALAANGGFAPDADGALSADRDPPGFEALGDFASAPKRSEDDERRREQAERERRLAERENLSQARREAHELLTAQQHAVSHLTRELDDAQQSLKKTQALLAELDERLASLSG